MVKRKLTAQQILAVEVSERSMSVLSVLGSLFIMATFLRWHYFRKPINRLVFYASFGNVMANIATLISTAAVPVNGAAPSSLCKFQGTLIQWFMMADSLWVFCMALNVMLVFFYQYNSRQLRRLEKWYLLFAYGVPFVPAFAYNVAEKATGKRLLGGATIWCWVDARVEWMRIAFFYAPVWIVIICTLTIYIVTGHTIFLRRKTLRSFSKGTTAGQAPPVINPFTAPVNQIERKTEISIQYTTESLDSDSTVVPQPNGNDSRSSFASDRQLANEAEMPITAPAAPSRFSKIDWAKPSRGCPEATIPQDDEPSTNYKAAIIAENRLSDIEASRARSNSISNHNPNVRRNATMEGNSAAWSYFKVAFLMFAALFIVWVPSTVNRLQQFINKDSPIFGLNLASALVLPLQGFWNAMVYISTTWPECKRAIKEVLDAIVAAKDHTQIPDQQRKDSEHTLTEGSPQGFNNNIPLSEIIEQSQPRPDLHSRMSSTESIQKVPQSFPTGR